MRRSKFSLSHYKLAAMDPGELCPVGITEVLPGDTIQAATSALIRVAPLVSPVMHPVHVRIHHWYVPHRLVWDDFEDFITGGPDGMDDSIFPTMTGTYVTGSLGDYLGLPVDTAVTHSALPFRAYAMIYNEWYRDQDLQNPLVISTASGADSTTSRIMQPVGWEKDYFTSSRPWEQKGPSISIPLGQEAPVFTKASVAAATTVKLGMTAADHYLNSGGANLTTGAAAGSTSGAQGLFTNLTGASNVTINLLREAFALQRFEEARARYGSRYVEYLRYLGVRSSDARLQRPEYLGGGKQTIQFSEVLQTAEGESPVGEMRGHGIGAMRSNRFRRFIEEHGYIITMISVKPKTMYMQGMPRHWNRRTKEDFWQRELQFIGQQEVLNKELYAAHATPDGVFGYQDRYDEYRRTESSVAGEFRNVLDYWHLARKFDTTPALNESFIRCFPAERIYADPSQKVLYVMANHSIQARRLVAQSGGSSHVF